MELYVITKLNQPSLMDVWRGLDIKALVVRVQDLISPKTLELNQYFYKIKNSGSIHNYLRTNKEVILSLVMKDEMIKNIDIETYVKIIKELKPNYFTTIDGWTYENQKKISVSEIQRCFKETIQIMKECPKVIPIGQVKGCSKNQLLVHLSLLKSIGIKKFMFHIGDYFRNGDEKFISIGKNYAEFIRKYVDELILYGMSSQKRLIEYSFADFIISFGYFVNARHGKRIINRNIIREKYSKSLVRKNLKEMINNFRKLKSQKKLIGGDNPWEEDQALVDQISQKMITIEH